MHDRDSSGDLDTFEMAAAVESLLGAPPTTKQVMAIVEEFDDDHTNTLDLDEFENVIREFDWTNQEVILSLV